MKFFLENIYAILSFIIMVISTIFSVILDYKKKQTEKMSIIKDTLSSNIEGLVIEAEKFLNYSGEEKKNYVLTRAKQYLNSVKCTKISDSSISEIIERFVNITKQVNQREKDINGN
jgi:hypothetical protein